MKTCPLCDTTYPSHHTNCPADGARLIASSDLEPGTVVCSKYRIERMLGRGGMGTVYLAQHILLDEPRALKFMSPELSRDGRFLKRFRMEAKAASGLQHPNVIGVLDLDQAEDGSPFIAMAYVEGKDLRGALANAPFPVERALAIARGVALGLIAAHSKGIVHRDIKPENILLAQSPDVGEVPKILDFGIAAMKESATAISRTRGVMLTPEYAAPEQWKGLAAEELDGRVDLYALGGVLHEMLTGSTGLHVHSTEGWMYQHLQVAPEAPSKVRPELAYWRRLDELVLRLLEKDRDQRTASAEAFVRELDAVRAGVPIVPTLRETVPKPAETLRAPLTHAVTISGAPVQQLTIPAPASDPIATKTSWPSRKLIIGAVIVLLVGIGAYAAWTLFHHPAQQAQNAPGELQQTLPRSSTSPTSSQANVGQSSSPKNQPPQNQPQTRPLPQGTTTSTNIPKPRVEPPSPGRPPIQGSSFTEVEQQAEALDKQKQYAEAAALYDKACAGANPVACRHLGRLYTLGQGVTKNYSQAVTLYQKSCDAGDAAGCGLLGSMYDAGWGVTKDVPRAIALYSKACAAGVAVNCGAIGNRYCVGFGTGYGMAGHSQELLALISEGCDAGDFASCSNLAYIYEMGWQVSRDFSRAVAIYSKSCDAGNALACNRAGQLYAEGRTGLPTGFSKDKDKEKAKEFFSKACTLGFQQGCANIQAVQ
jgi:serine/threonine protein kinase